MSEIQGRGSPVPELAAYRGKSRALNYCERAAQLRAMAETETVVRLRVKLLDLADQFEALAARWV
jgi:hypothetical protein